MNEVRKAQGVVSSDAGRAKESEDGWYVYTLHYPKSLTQIPMLRMIIRGGDGWIVAITDAEEKKGKIIADCAPGLGEYGPYFSTYSHYRGHEELCRHLKSNGVGGDYKKYLTALDEGKKATATELSNTAMIRFSTRMADEEFEEWDIDMSFREDEGKKEENETKEEPEEETDVEED